MSTITLPNVRIQNDVKMNVSLKDNGVSVDWTSLSNISAALYSDTQRLMAGPCAVAIDATDHTNLIVNYSATQPQYLGIQRLVVRCTYQAKKKTYDIAAFNFVGSTDDLEGETITITDPEIDVELEVSEVSTSLLDEVLDACIAATVGASRVAQSSVLFDAPQSLTDAQKQQARTNIGAGTGGGSVDAYTKAETNALLAVKQNASDNALQTSDKTIVGAINENKGDIDGKYTKPSGGIPATDMASAVQTSLGKADTALQSQEQADWNETDTTDPAYIKNKPTIPTLPTIATGINTQSTNTEVAGAKAVYDYHDASKADKIGVSTALPADGALLANTFYDIATLSGEMTLSCAAAVGYAEYMLKFSTGGTAPTITWSGITWASGSAPTIAANKTYEVNVLDGVAIFVEY